MKGIRSETDLPADINPDWRIGIIPALYHRDIVERMVQGAIDTFAAAGVTNVTQHPTIGSFEIPLIGARLAASGAVDALIGIGVVLEGETNHADLITGSVAQAMMDVQVQSGIPFAFEVLQVSDLRLADERSRGEHNKGIEAAESVLHSLAELAKLGS